MKSYHEIRGDGGSDIIGQVVGRQEAIAAALAGVKHLLAIGSGKGGVGKSTVTMALAQVLNRRGKRVAILDGDFNGPCQAQMAGLSAVPWLPGEKGLVLPRRRDGLGVLSFGSFLPQASPVELASVAQGDEHTWRATKEFTILAQLLSSVEWGELDFLLFDLPPGAERTRHFAEFLDKRTAFVLVTIPSDLAHGVVARSSSAVKASSERLLGYIENMAGYFCRVCGEVRPLFPEARITLDMPRLGRVPFDPVLAEHCDRGWPEPLDGNVEPMVAVEAAADRILEALESEPGRL